MAGGHPVEATLLGLHLSGSGETVGKVLQVSRCDDPAAPAENAYIYVELTGPEEGRGRYLSWVNLYDIEIASAREPDRWRLSEPPATEVLTVDWRPYGWGAPPFPNVAH